MFSKRSKILFNYKRIKRECYTMSEKNSNNSSIEDLKMLRNEITAQTEAYV